MRTKYHWTQVLVGLCLSCPVFCVTVVLQGVLISIGGLCLLVVSDMVTGKHEQASSRVAGDALMLVAATAFGICAYSDESIMNP